VFLQLKVSGDGNLITWLQSGINVLSVEGEVKVIQAENGEKKADMYREFSLVNPAIKTIRGNRTKIINEFEQNGSGIKRFREAERCVVSETLLKWFNLLKPTGYRMHQQVEYFNNCTLCSRCIYVFCV
jgi:hypothetical protein